jgi:hypothetical protein
MIMNAMAFITGEEDVDVCCSQYIGEPNFLWK